jgi:hypothetical protein
VRSRSPRHLQILNSRVSSVDSGTVTIIDKNKTQTEVPFGACVWATGVAMNPLVKQIQGQLPQQTHFRALLTDERLRVLGTKGSMWAIGDASTVYSPKALDYADSLFEEGDVGNSGTLSISELRVCARLCHSDMRHGVWTSHITQCACRGVMCMTCTISRHYSHCSMARAKQACEAAEPRAGHPAEGERALPAV